MVLFNRPPSSSSLKSEKSAANTKKNVRFSDQSPDESLESHETSVKSEPCVKSEAEKKSSASVDMPELKPSKCLYNKKSAYYVMREVCDYETHQMIELKRRLQDKLADYTYEELLDLERKVDPSLGYLQLFFKRAITAKMSTELQIGLELLG